MCSPLHYRPIISSWILTSPLLHTRLFQLILVYASQLVIIFYLFITGLKETWFLSDLNRCSSRLQRDAFPTKLKNQEFRELSKSVFYTVLTITLMIHEWITEESNFDQSLSRRSNTLSSHLNRAQTRNRTRVNGVQNRCINHYTIRAYAQQVSIPRPRVKSTVLIPSQL